MKLWGGRFTKETDQLVQNFNESLSFDQKFYRQDIRGSIAHVKMLAKQGILSEEGQRCHHRRSGRHPQEDLDERQHWPFLSDSDYEDIHSFVEGTLNRAHWRGRKASSHRTQPQRSGGSGYEAVYKR